ncbi:MAG: cyclic nucleotide-binding domain-containing protein [Pseudomonadota bacterium]
MDATDWSILVHLASGTYVAGYLLRDQLWLRLLLLLGTFFYIGYYYLEPSEPLWEAIVWSSLMAVANTFMIMGLVRDRASFGMAAEHARLYERFSPMSPGDFRRLMRIAQSHSIDAETVLTREGELPGALYYVTEGTIEIEKGSQRFSIEAPSFIGEVSLLMGGPATATVRIRPNARYLAWERTTLHALLERRETLQHRFDKILGRDMAGKVGAGTRNADTKPDQEAAPL